MVNYEIKALVLKCGLEKTVDKVGKAFYKQYLKSYLPFPDEIKDCKNDIPYEKALEIFHNWHSSEEGCELWHEAEKIVHASMCRKLRVKNRVEILLKKPCLFLTLTFRNDVLENTSSETRRKYVRDFLSQFGEYVGNIDYGEEHEREHYHAILQVDGKIDLTSWQYGNLDGKRVRNPNSQALSKYITKLTNHAIKETTRGCRIIYSRGKRPIGV